MLATVEAQMHSCRAPLIDGTDLIDVVCQQFINMPNLCLGHYLQFCPEGLGRLSWKYFSDQVQQGLAIAVSDLTLACISPTKVKGAAITTSPNDR